MLSTQKLSKISDYEPIAPDANIVPFIQGEVVSDEVKPYRVKRRLNETHKLILIVLTVFVFGALLPVLLLPFVFKFVWMMGIYLAILLVSKGEFGTGGRNVSVYRSAPGKSIVPFS